MCLGGVEIDQKITYLRKSYFTNWDRMSRWVENLAEILSAKVIIHLKLASYVWVVEKVGRNFDSHHHTGLSKRNGA